MATSYNAADQVVTTTYPADNSGALGEVVTHSYNSIGQLNQLVSDDTAQFVSSASYNPRGQLTHLTSGSGLSRGYQYNATTMRLDKIEAGAGTSNDRQELSYGYDNRACPELAEGAISPASPTSVMLPKCRHSAMIGLIG